MKNREQLACWIHHSAAVTGGYLGVYALLTRADLFGNAQTANLIYFVTSLLGHNLTDALLRIIGAVIFCSGIALTVILSKKTSCSLPLFSLTVSSLTVLLLGFLPAQMNNVIALYPIFFATAVQWNSYPGAYGFTSSTIFSTNNLRQVANAVTEYCITHDPRQKQKAIFFGGTIVCYHLGVALSVFTHHLFGIHAVWLCCIPLMISGALIAAQEQPVQNKTNSEVRI